MPVWHSTVPLQSLLVPLSSSASPPDCFVPSRAGALSAAMTQNWLSHSTAELDHCCGMGNAPLPSAAVSPHFDWGFAVYLQTGADGPYQDLCSQVTKSFSECSRQVLEIEATLKDPKVNRSDLAEVLQAVQLQEKQKLHMTVTLQVLRRAGRPSERASSTSSQVHGQSSSSHPDSAHCSHGLASDVPGDGTGLEMAQLEAEYEAAIKEATGALQNAVIAINEHIEEVRYEIEELQQRGGANLNMSGQD